MDEALNQDVNLPDETTGDIASDIEQTAETEETTQESGAEDQSPELKTVPYDRFSEVNAERQEYKQTLSQVQQELAALRSAQKPQVDPVVVQEKETIKQQLAPLLEEMGYVSKAELQRREADRNLESTLSTLENRYSGKDGAPKFVRQEVVNYAVQNGINNPEAAYKLMHQTDIINAAVQRALTQGKGIKTESSNGSGVSQVGTTNEDLKSAMAKGDSSAKSLLFKRLAKQALGNS